MVKFILLCICIIMLWIAVSEATPTYEVIIKNQSLLDNNTLGFDVFIKSDSTFVLSSYQCVINFKCNDLYGDVFRFKYVTGSSQLRNFPNILMDLDFTNEYSQIKFASGVDFDTISSVEKRIGSFILIRNGYFQKNSLLLSWNFQGNNPTILTDLDFNDVTNAPSFTSLPLNNQVEVLGKSPTEFYLSQNFPNPFNPTTTIKYQISQKINVSLVVYNILGKVVETLVNGIEEPGFKEVKFNGYNLSSGVYIYVLRAGDKYVKMKKMLLLK